jgi:general nucleoside transport system permease protein
MKRFGPFIVEQRSQPNPWWTLLVSLASIALSLVLFGLVFLLVGQNPLSAYQIIGENTLASPSALATVLQRATPLILIGVGLVLAIRARFFNIGAEGQLIAGAFAGAAVALSWPGLGPLLLPAMFVAGALGGALWGLLPSVLKLRLQVDEVITTLMMNYIALNLGSYLVNGPWRGKSAFGFAYSDTFPDGAWLPLIPNTSIHWPTLLLGLLLAIAVHFLLSNTVLGYKMRVVGQSPATARYAGINSLGTTLLVM